MTLPVHTGNFVVVHLTKRVLSRSQWLVNRGPVPGLQDLDGLGNLPGSDQNAADADSRVGRHLPIPEQPIFT